MSPTPTKRFWDAAADLIAVTEKHPFLVAMVDGTLDIDPFKYYVVQDAIYLTSFAVCLNLLGDKLEASGHDVHSKRVRELAVGAEEDEKALHRGIFKQLGIEATAEAMPNTLLYTANMTSIVATRPVAEGLVSLLPCFWIYWHVGKKMLELRDQLGETVGRPSSYDAWIDMYGGDDFEREVKDYIDIVDDVCKDADEEALTRMEGHFIMSCKLEHMFWDQAQDLMQWPEITAQEKKEC